MNLKSLYKAYYHQLYDAIKYLDQEAINRTGQSAIRLLNTNIDQLSALISLLIHVDETLPLIRCQGALGRFKKDFADLYLNYLEANLVKAHPELFDENREIGQILSHEEYLSKDRYAKSLHELYLNTIHATGKVVENHINDLNDDILRIKTNEYFQNLVNIYREHLQDADFDSLDLVLDEIYYNLSIFQGVKTIGDEFETDVVIKHLLTDVQHLKEMLVARKLYHDTAKKLRFYGRMDDDLDRDLLGRMQSIESSLLHGGGYLDAFGDQLLSHLSKILWLDNPVV